MEKMSAVRSICRAASFRSSIIATANNHHVRQSLSSRTLFGLSSPSVSIPSKSLPSGTSLTHNLSTITKSYIKFKMSLFIYIAISSPGDERYIAGGLLVWVLSVVMFCTLHSVFLLFHGLSRVKTCVLGRSLRLW